MHRKDQQLGFCRPALVLDFDQQLKFTAGVSCRNFIGNGIFFDLIGAAGRKDQLRPVFKYLN
ncbi:MAG: hypothetical protein ACD_75C01367G0003 [uncultured bacterium]|nr:MAG: hypothetical protein ACD_75C01367G0003 [uncultured bacterium]